MSVYGYWISKDDVIEVPTWGHEGKGYEILEQAHGIPAKAIEETGHGVYSFMFALGYVRVVNDYGDSHKVNYWPGAKFSRLQKQFIKEAETEDHWSVDDLSEIQEVITQYKH